LNNRSHFQQRKGDRACSPDRWTAFFHCVSTNRPSRTSPQHTFADQSSCTSPSSSTPSTELIPSLSSRLPTVLGAFFDLSEQLLGTVLAVLLSSLNFAPLLSWFKFLDLKGSSWFSRRNRSLWAHSAVWPLFAASLSRWMR
jgi:hypothetical protein